MPAARAETAKRICVRDLRVHPWCVVREITFAHLIAPGNMQLFWSSGVKSRPGGFIFTRNGQHFFQISQMVRTALFLNARGSVLEVFVIKEFKQTSV